MAVVEAEVVGVVLVLEDMTGPLDDVLVDIATDIDEGDTTVPVAAGVEAAKLTPLILRVTPTLPHNCCANRTVAEEQNVSVDGPARS
ncbi:hypothetical protein MMC17_007610 [Xylographa soralifera]|nr:hypothetical protein [Xylographa soralifera]